MSYIVESELRNGALYPYIRIPAAGDGAVNPARLTLLIQAASDLVDSYTRDHFEGTTTTLRVQGTGRTQFLYLPKRVRAVSAVVIYDRDDVGTAVGPEYWRIHSSFPIMGANTIGNEGRDGLELKKPITGLNLTYETWPGDTCLAGFAWPGPPKYIDISGAFDWAQIPEEVKQATALLVWKMCNSELPPGLDRVDSASVIFTLAKAGQDTTGLPEVDALLQRFRRFQDTGYGVPV